MQMAQNQTVRFSVAPGQYASDPILPGAHLVLLTLFLAVILAPLVIVTGYFAIELFCGLTPFVVPSTPERVPATTIVIPAHDEQTVIAGTVSRIVSDLGESASVLVVADNCVDNTAMLARSAGASVLVRNDESRRGKGFALAACRDELRAFPPDVVLVLDADCRMDAESIRRLASAAASGRRACQSVNLLAPDLGAAPMVQISTFAFMIKNLIRQRGLQRLAGRAHLTGTGMAMPWTIFDRVEFGGSNIVEDLALGIELGQSADPPMLVEGATVWSPAASQSGTLVQRRRWEGGYLSTMKEVAPRALARSVVSADLRGMAAALNLCVPPLALLIVLNLVGTVGGLVAVLIGASAWPVLVQLVTGIAAGVALAIAWAREGRRFASGSTILRLPLYLLWKIPLYLGLARRGKPDEWLRTGR